MNNQSTDIGRFAFISHQHSDHQQKNKKQKASALERFDYPEHTTYWPSSEFTKQQLLQ